MGGLEQQSLLDRMHAWSLNVVRGRDVVRTVLAGVLLVGAPDISRVEQPHAVSVQERGGEEVEEKSSEQKLVEAYAPKVEGDMDDLKIDAKKLLLGIPGVVEVKRFPSKEKPTRRIVQLLDWHWIPRIDFEEEPKLVRELRAFDEDYLKKREDAIVRNMPKGGLLILGGGHDLSDNTSPDCEYLRITTKAYQECRAAGEGDHTEAEVGARYERFLKEVEAVQANQRVAIRCLARRHGVEFAYQGEIHVLLKELFRDQVQAVREYGDHPLFRGDRLKIGAGGQLLAEGVLREVRAADSLSVWWEGMERRKIEK